MNRETSVYLDIVRLSAAMVVFVGHVSGMRLTGGFLWQFGPYMSQAVTVFFVLSGFVIAYVTDGREGTARIYSISRLARIYSVALPALVLTIALDTLGRTVNPDVYNATWGYHADGRIWQFLSGLFFVHQIWFSDVSQGSCLPYWSLGYEAWYYLIFGLFFFSRRRLLWTGLAMAAAGPAILAMFPLWLLGVGTYRLARTPHISTFRSVSLWIGSFAGWIAYEAWAARHGRLVGFAPAWLRRPELLQDYLIGTLFAANLLGFAAAAPLFARPMASIASVVRWGA
nr:acyltransferase family protein [Rhodospirillales bacterium]